MNYTFVPMNQDDATTIVDPCKYENEYSIYDCSHEADHLLDTEGWGRGAEFVTARVEYTVRQCRYRGEYARLGVA